MIKELKFKKVGNPKRSYKQDEFIFSTFNITGNSGKEMSEENVEKAIVKLKGLGLNQIELAWSHHNVGQFAMKYCEREKINFIWQDTSMFGGFQGKIHKITTEEEVKKIVEETKKYKYLKGYYVWDEPWEDADIKATREQTDWFFKYAPDKHAFSVMVPNYNPDYTWKNGKYPSFVARFLDEIEPPVASVDYYPFGEGDNKEYDGAQIDNSNIWKDMGVVRREAQKRNMPFWFYFQTLRTADFPKHTFPMTRVQVNNAILYAALCLQCYGLAGALVSPDKLEEKRRVLEFNYEEGCFYDDMKILINNVRNLGKTLIALKSEHIYHGKEVLPKDEYFNNNLREDIANDEIINMKELPKRCSIGVLGDDYNNKYLAILNRDYVRSNTFEINLNEEKRIYEVSKANGNHYVVNDKTNIINVTLEPGDMALLRVDDCGKEKYSINYIAE